jgi:hypothetical protein
VVWNIIEQSFNRYLNALGFSHPDIIQNGRELVSARTVR